MAGMSTAGYAAVAAGEDWHYVGEAGEPAFEGGWDNVGGTWPSMAFRLRAGGTVDLVAVIENTDGSPGVAVVFPTGYVPLNASRVAVPYTRLRSGTYSARVGTLDQSGYLTLADANTVGDVVYINLSYFIGNADAP